MLQSGPYIGWSIDAPIRFSEEQLAVRERESIANICACVNHACGEMDIDLLHNELHGKSANGSRWLVTFYTGSVGASLQKRIETEMEAYEVQVYVDPKLSSYARSNYGSAFCAPLVVSVEREAYAQELLDRERLQRLQQESKRAALEAATRSRRRSRPRAMPAAESPPPSASGGINKLQRKRSPRIGAVSGMVYGGGVGGGNSASNSRHRDQRSFFAKLYDGLLGVDYAKATSSRG